MQKSLANRAAAVLAMGAAAMGLTGTVDNTLGFDTNITKPKRKSRRKSDAMAQSTSYQGFPSRQVYRAEKRAATKASLPLVRSGGGVIESSRKRRATSKQHHFFDREMKGISGAKLYRRAMQGTVGLARLK